MIVDTILAKVIGTQNERDLKRLRAHGRRHQLEAGSNGSPTSCLGKTAEFRAPANGETLDDVLPEAFAVVREAGRRVLKMRHFDVQLIGGMVPHRGKIAMKTGEGKTLVATLPAYLCARGQGRACRDGQRLPGPPRLEWMGRLYRFLGMSVGVIQHDERPGAPGAYAPTLPRHEQRVRIRLPPRQHEVRPRTTCSEGTTTRS